jgi:hypothetical protein
MVRRALQSRGGTALPGANCWTDGSFEALRIKKIRPRLRHEGKAASVPDIVDAEDHTKN